MSTLSTFAKKSISEYNQKKQMDEIERIIREQKPKTGQEYMNIVKGVSGANLIRSRKKRMSSMYEEK